MELDAPSLEIYSWSAYAGGNDRMRSVCLLGMFGAIALLPTSSLWAQSSLAARIGHTDPSKYTRSRSHNSAGDMACELLVPPSAMDVNLNFMHRCQIMPGGGVGHHFHN